MKSKVAGILTLLALTIVSAPAFADGGHVQFSYEKVRLSGTPEWVLVPQAANFGTKNDPNALRAAFDSLKKAKRATYGKSIVTVAGTTADKAKVTVTIDKAVARYALIIIAETVYTLTELGAKEVQFPGYAKGGVKRSDVPFPAYTLTVPLWKAIGRFSSPSVMVAMPDGSIEPSTAIAKRWASKDSKLRSALYGYLKTGDSFTVTSVAKLLPQLKVPYGDEVIPLLADSSAGVRQTALEVLAGERNDAKVLAAVEKMLGKEKDAKLALEAAKFLGKAKSDKYSVLEQYFMLERGTDKEKAEAAKALSKSKDSRTPGKLAPLLTASKPVATVAAASLASVGASKEQLAALKNTKIDAAIRLDIARDLAGQKSDDSAVAGAEYVAENAPNYEGVAAVQTLAKRGSDAARKSVEGFLSHKKAYLREAAVGALVKRSDPDSIDALATASQKGPDAEMMEDAGYSIMVSQPLKAIMSKTKDKDKLVRRIAYRAIGERAQKEKAGAKVFSVLESGTKDRDPLIRGAAARAIATFSNKEATAVVAKLVNDSNAGVRRDVALAIGFLPEGELADQLKKYLDDSDPGVQAGAIESLGRRGEAFAWDRVKALSDSKAPEVRAASLGALSRLVSRSDQEGVREVISKLSGGVSDSSVVVAERAVRELGTFKDDKAVTAIALLVSSENERLRVAAVEALGNTGHSSAHDLVRNVLGDSNRNVRAAAIEAAGRLKDSKAKPVLTDRLKVEKDKELVELIKQTLKKI